MATLHYSKGFVGAVALDGAPLPCLRLPTVVTGETVTQMEAPGCVVLAIGERLGTGAITAGGDFAAIRGRPFPLDDRPVGVPTPGHDPAAGLARLDGRFSLAAAGDGRLLLATDLLGAGGLFVIERRRRVYFATTLGLLTAALDEPVAPDPRGMATVLAGTCMIGGRTPVAGAERLGPAGYVVVRPGTSRPVEHGRYVDVAEVLTKSVAPPHEAEEAFGHLLMASLRREAALGDLGVMLSGGRDSTALAVAHVEAALGRPPAATFGEWRSSDVYRATLFARRMDMPHKRIPYRAWSFRDWQPFIGQIGGGASGLQTAHTVYGHSRAGGGAATWTSGYLGDALTGAHLPRGGQDALAPVLPVLDYWTESFGDLYGEPLAEARSDMEATLHGWRSLPAHQQAMLLDLTIRQATWISSTFELCEWHTPLCYPFFSRRLMQLMLSQPEEALRGQALYDRWRATRTTQPPRRLRTLPYQIVHRALDKAHAATGRFPTVPLVDWRARFTAERDWLAQQVENVADPVLALLLRDQLALAGRRDSAIVPLLVGLGVAAAGANAAHDRSDRAEPTAATAAVASL